MERGTSLRDQSMGSDCLPVTRPPQASKKRANQQQLRKRASKACAVCRERKVRCDVTQRGQPCTNCSFDNIKCFVKPRAGRSDSSRAKATGLSAVTAPPSARPPQEDPKVTSPDKNILSIDDNVSTDPLTFPSGCQRDFEGYIPGNFNLASLECDSFVFDEYAYHNIDTERRQQFILDSPKITPLSDAQSVTPSFEPPPREHTLVHFSYYSFLKLNTGTLSQISPEEFNFLDKQGCFAVPTKPALDEFVEEYFLHVHPNLPILNEGIFWNLYGNSETRSCSPDKIPLFLFRAMLFASCSFMSQKTLNLCGFKSLKQASSKLYRLAKLVYDFEVENDPVSIAQGALLLTFYCPKGDSRKINSFWLGVAIQAARWAGAHNYDLTAGSSRTQQNILKRIWWCCILRDRILPLGMRRPLQITPDHFDFSKTPLTADDFDDEIEISRVYDATSKRLLVRVFVSQFQLAICLTKVLMTIYHLNGSQNFTFRTDEELTTHSRNIEQCKSQLDGWFDNAVINLPSKSCSLNSHKSVTLYTNLTYIYYHSARMALYQHEALVFESDLVSHNRVYRMRLSNVKSELNDAEAGITENVKELVQLGLIKNLPISALAFTALPLILYTLNLKLSSTDRQRAITQRRLDIFNETMKVAGCKYEGTEIMGELIKMTQDIGSACSEKSLELSPADKSDSGSLLLTDFDSPTPAADWSELFVQQPKIYLRLALLLDITVDKGRLADEADYPSVLQGSKTCEATEAGQPNEKSSIAEVVRGNTVSQDEIMTNTNLRDLEGGLDVFLLDGCYT